MRSSAPGKRASSHGNSSVRKKRTKASAWPEPSLRRDGVGVRCRKRRSMVSVTTAASGYPTPTTSMEGSSPGICMSRTVSTARPMSPLPSVRTRVTRGSSPQWPTKTRNGLPSSLEATSWTSTSPSGVGGTAIVGSADAVTEEAAGVGGGLLVVLDGDFAVDEDPSVARCPLDAPPLVAGQVVRDLARPGVEVLEVVHDDVGRPADAHRAAVAEAGQ